ncbi:Fic family protein [Paremcibacter congregatus]|uniref:Fic family protein n=1 Tax=Paremcibacter congregatus TaxID=2043170 RepID=UPI0030EB8617|tara:strand:+ start:154 stop:1278 length:1125 start_codon:yes stop_codon:yes gene_type:complete
MTFIHENPDWPNFIWDDAILSPKLAALRYAQGRIIGRMQALGFAYRQEAGLVALTDEIVKSSAIEGEHLGAAEVRSSIARRLGLEVGGLVPANRDVDGIVEMMIDATQNYMEPLTQERLFGWHAALFPTGRSGMRRITVGAWRTEAAGAMQVVSGPIGREKVHFEAPTANRLDGEMSRFLNWYNTPVEPARIDPVLKAAIAHFWFVTIHPFEDGNGRIARAIADMALARADGAPERFYSMSAQIEVERNAYYNRLEAAQRREMDLTPWLEWFLDCLERAFDRAEMTLQSVLEKDQFWQGANYHALNERQRHVLTRMLDNWQGYLNTSKYAKLAKCSNDTALRDIRELLAAGLLIQNPGGGRSTSYRLAAVDEMD